MKKILFFVESLHCGGAEKSLLSLLNNIDLSRYDINLMVFVKGGEFEKFVPQGIDIKHADVNIGAFERIKFKLLRFLDIKNKNHNAQLFWKSINSKIPKNEEAYDLAIAWGQGFATYYVSQKINAVKKLAWVNIDYKKAGYNWKMDLDLYKNFNKVVGVSDFVKESMQQFLPNEQVISIRNIIDPDEITNRAELPKKDTFCDNCINIVSVGRLAKQKGFELAIRAMKILTNENSKKIHLYIIGEGPERAFLENEIETNMMSENCTLLGFRDNPYPYIKAADIYLQSSWFEGLGRTIIEAGLLCKPIVTTNFPTAHSILKQEKTGLIVNMTPIDIANGLKRIIDNNDFKNTLIHNLKHQEDNEKEKTLRLVYDLFDTI
ncbi:glycosyltransferase [Tamlana sp. I1]|uniref:glycosyltransferase n=1 Tax=Tamlana sp. I1 TaxID=2762061 RepID=UPI001890828E|nr:glycosyltransferase [Tamlana sp. I1]